MNDHLKDALFMGNILQRKQNGGKRHTKVTSLKKSVDRSPHLSALPAAVRLLGGGIIAHTSNCKGATVPYFFIALSI